MSISRIAIGVCDWFNRVNPKTPEENQVIQYGIELLLDNIVKFLFIQLFGMVIGKGFETFVILIVFCGLRLQAGGIHARTGLGCGLSMFLIWGVSMLGSIFFKLNPIFLPYIYAFSVIIILRLVPRTINIEYFTLQERKKKKFFSIVLLTSFVAVVSLKPSLRELIIYPVILEVLTLLPENKKTGKGGTIYEEEDSKESAEISG